MVTTELKPDKILTLDTFIEILKAVDDKIHKEPDNEKLREIQGALYEILAMTHQFEMINKEKVSTMLFPYETVISIEVVPNQLPRLEWTGEMLSRLV